MSFLRTGHLDDCPTPNAPCICEAPLYLAVGTLALFSGLVQWAVGYYASMAVASDALHALFDASMDFLGFFTVIMARRMGNSDVIEKVGIKVLVAVFAIGAVAVGMHAVERLTEGTYRVVPFAIVAVCVLATAIHALRWKMLARAKHHLGLNPRLIAIIAHAKYDMFHSGLIAIIGGFALLGTMLPFDQELYAQALKWMDFGLLFILTLYMLYTAKKIWFGHGHDYHGHDHHH